MLYQLTFLLLFSWYLFVILFLKQIKNDRCEATTIGKMSFIFQNFFNKQ
jgi:hypothetical protein